MKEFDILRNEYLLNGEINPNKSVELLKKFRDNIKKYEEDIYEALIKDLNKSKYESYISELGIVYNELRYFIKHTKRLRKLKKVKTPIAQFPSSGYIKYDAYGVVLIISPWNYPIQLALAPLVGAIACGNRVMLKPSEYSVNTSEVINKIISETFNEKECVCMLGDAILSSELSKQNFDYIFFTGSTFVGKKVYEEASKNLTPVTLELGGKSPVLVIDGNMKLVAKRLVFGKFLNAGQTCVAPDYILIKEELKDEFLSELKNQIIKYIPDLNLKTYPKIINEKHFNRLISLIDDSLYFGGNYDSKSNKIYPTILVNPKEDSKVLSEEIFGPILPVISVKDENEMIKYVNSFDKPLALYIFSHNKGLIKHILSHTSSGGVCLNDTLVHLACHNLPFGGVGASGIGEYHGINSFYTFSHKKSVLDRKTYLDINLRYQPYEKRSLNLIKKIMK